MFQELYFTLYGMDLWAATALFLGIVLIWSVIGSLFRKRMRIICLILAIVLTGVILYITLLSRRPGPISHEVRPFSTLTLGPKHPELYRAAVMNIFMFVPLGMTLPFVFETKPRNRFLLTLLIGFCLSAGIEVAQHFMLVGITQTDDVICNTLGTALGACAYPLSLLWTRLRDRKKTKQE